MAGWPSPGKIFFFIYLIITTALEKQVQTNVSVGVTPVSNVCSLTLTKRDERLR